MKAEDLRKMRIVLALVWIATGIVVMAEYPPLASLNLLARLEMSGQSALVLLYSAAALDIAMGVMTLAYPRKLLWLAQTGIILVYTLIISIWLPEFWLHPFGPILKNLPILLLLHLLHKYDHPAK